MGPGEPFCTSLHLSIVCTPLYPSVPLCTSLSVGRVGGNPIQSVPGGSAAPRTCEALPLCTAISVPGGSAAPRIRMYSRRCPPPGHPGGRQWVPAQQRGVEGGGSEGPCSACMGWRTREIEGPLHSFAYLSRTSERRRERRPRQHSGSPKVAKKASLQIRNVSKCLTRSGYPPQEA